MKSEKKNNRSLLIAMMTIFVGVLLMNQGILDSTIPDGIVCVIGVAAMIAAALSVFFAARALIKAKANEDSSEKE